jgi:hypothetical protein
MRAAQDAVAGVLTQVRATIPVRRADVARDAATENAGTTYLAAARRRVLAETAATDAASTAQFSPGCKQPPPCVHWPVPVSHRFEQHWALFVQSASSCAQPKVALQVIPSQFSEQQSMAAVQPEPAACRSWYPVPTSLER